MNNDLRCAICLAIDQRAQPAVATYAGHSLCRDHFRRSDAQSFFTAMLAKEHR